jgi:cytidylate kinase
MKTTRTILHLATMGHAIIVGRGAGVIGRRLDGGLHVRLIGSPARRLERMKEFYKLSEPEARAAMERLDNGRRSYVRKYFKADVRDPLLYDLVINTDHVSYERAATIIAEAAPDGA